MARRFLLILPRRKLYKEKFDAWRWQKNLPGEHAHFMVKKANKRKRDENKETTFIYRGLRWTAERAKASASRTKKADSNAQITGDWPHSFQFG